MSFWRVDHKLKTIAMLYLQVGLGARFHSIDIGNFFMGTVLKLGF
jgi:hypothetical protein